MCCVCVYVSQSVMSDSLQSHGLYVTHQAPLSMEFSRQEYWIGLPLPSPGDLPNPGIEPGSPALQTDSLPPEPLVQFSSVTQSCLTLCDPMDSSLAGSFVHGILQARILEWVAISFSRGSSQSKDQSWVSCIADRFFTI